MAWLYEEHLYSMKNYLQVPARALKVLKSLVSFSKGRTIRKLMGVGGGGREVQKKYSRKGKLNEKKFMHAN